MAKQKYIRSGIVFDPNIEDYYPGESSEARSIYRKGKQKRKKYFGI